MPDSLIPKLDFQPLQNTVSEAEWQARVDLAAAFRLGHHLGWNDTIRNHITARIPDDPDHFLMNAYGLGWQEVTASNLLKLDLDGNIVTETDHIVAAAGVNFHSAVLRARPDLSCVFHIHPLAGTTISALEDGLKYLDQGGTILYGRIGTHEFEGLADEADEGVRIVNDLGEKNVGLLMLNHGLLTVGRTVFEAFVTMRALLNTCQLQERVMATGAKFREIPVEICERTAEQIEVRREGNPWGHDEWPMYLRWAEQLDPRFRT